VGYEVVAPLLAQTVVYPLGTYGDFVQVAGEFGGEKAEGFVWAGALETLPPGLHELASAEVPWQPIFILNNFLSDRTVFQGDQIRLESSPAYYDVEGMPIPLDAPFMLTVGLQVSGALFGAIKLLGIPEPTDKPWWQGIRRLDIFVSGDALQLGLRDGTSEDFQTTIPLPVNPGQPLSLVFLDPQGQTFSVLDQNQRPVMTINVTAISGLRLPDGLFPERKLYLGASSAPHSTLTLSAISLRQAPVGKMTSAAAREPGLRELARRKGITIGTEFLFWQMRDGRYWDIMAHEYNVAVISEFSCYKGFWRGRGDYDFAPLDRIVDFALQQGWRVRAFHLVWGAEVCPLPDWLLQGQFSRQEYVQILEEHVKTVVTHFQGRVTEWSIANEAISRSLYNWIDFWRDNIGLEYIEMAFRWAREADPQAILIFNDFNNDGPRDPGTEMITNEMYATVKELKSQGVPIDVVGMQMHVLLPWASKVPPQKEDVLKTMRLFADLGVAIYVTEFDVDLHAQTGSQQERWDYEASLYREMMEACLESGVCQSFTTWGVSDSTSWITCPWDGCVKFLDADPLMFDREFRPKPAYYAVRDALANLPDLNPAPP
jgi:endo-1,4-beta-xylanase